MDSTVSVRKLLAILNWFIKTDPEAAETLLLVRVKVNDKVRAHSGFSTEGNKKNLLNGLGLLSAILRTEAPKMLVASSFKEKRLQGVKIRMDDCDQTSPNPTWYDAFGDVLGVKLSGIQARLTDSEKRWLWEAVQTLPESSVYVEVGTDKGGSAHIVASAHPSVRIFSIDPMNADAERLEFLSNRYGDLKARIDLVPYVSVDEEGTALQHILKKLGDSEAKFDMVFLDGAHTGEDISQEIDFYLPRIRPGGMICGHDFHRNFSKRKRYSTAVVEGMKKYGLSLWIFDRIWYAITEKE